MFQVVRSNFTDKVSTVVDVLIGAKATQSCSPISGPTSHLKMTGHQAFFLGGGEPKLKGNGVQTHRGG